MEELINHGLHALRETLQQDKELTNLNTSIGIVGTRGESEKGSSPARRYLHGITSNLVPDVWSKSLGANIKAGGAFRILEDQKIDGYLAKLPPKEDAGAAAAQPPPAAGDADVPMEG